MTSLWKLLEAELGKNDAVLHKSIKQLASFFTDSRDPQKLASYLENPGLRRAYLAYYLPLNALKIITVFSENKNKLNPLTEASKQRWLDFGCGPGTATLATLAFLQEQKIKPVQLEIDLVDRNLEILKTAKTLIEKFATQNKWQVHVRTSTDLPIADARYDLILAANVLNELPTGDLLINVWEHLYNSGVFLLLEPAHRVSSQKLIRFRERLLKKSNEVGIHILAPCTHQEQCPLLRTKHWCHFSEPVQDSKLIQLNLRVFKNPRTWLKFSYFLAKKEPEPMRDPALFRAIGDLHPSGPGKLAIDLCAPRQKQVLIVPKRAPQALLKRLFRGNLVSKALKIKE